MQAFCGIQDLLLMILTMSNQLYKGPPLVKKNLLEGYIFSIILFKSDLKVINFSILIKVLFF